MSPTKPSEDTLRKMLDIQWQDHFQTRSQTWKALEITSILAVALVGFDWQVDNRIATIGGAILLFLVAQFGVLITLKHRIVEITKFRKISELERELGIADENLKLPQPISWWSIFQFRKSNTPLFILRMHFAIQVFAIGYCIMRLLWISP
jgi:hypothetical protein